MDRSTAIKNWITAQFDINDYTQHKAQHLAVAHEEMRPFVSKNESLDALRAGVDCADILKTLADVESAFVPQPHRYARKSWLGDRIDAQTSAIQPGDEAMHRVGGSAVDRLIDIVETVKWGQVGACFVTNRRDGWGSDRILTLYVNRRPRFVAYDRDGGVTAYLIPEGAAEWIFAIERHNRRIADAEYAQMLVRARRAVAASYNGDLSAAEWRFEPGQAGGVVHGAWGTVSANGAEVAEVPGISLNSGFWGSDVVELIR